MSRRVLRGLCLGFCAAAVACAGTLDSQVRTLAEQDLRCPGSEIEVREVLGGRLRAGGCGLTGTYLCITRPGYSTVCSLEAAPVAATE